MEFMAALEWIRKILAFHRLCADCAADIFANGDINLLYLQLHSFPNGVFYDSLVPAFGAACYTAETPLFYKSLLIAGRARYLGFDDGVLEDHLLWLLGIFVCFFIFAPLLNSLFV